MELFKRGKVIESLLFLLDIPRFIFPYETYDGIGPSDPDYFDKYEDRRKEKEKSVKDFLGNATDEELCLSMSV